MLFELLPHVARLVPMADRFLTTRSTGERAQEAALAAMAEGVRGDLGQVTEMHSGIYRQLQAQSAQIAEAAVEGTRTRMTVESVDLRVAKLEKRLGTATGLLWVVLAMLVGTLALLSMILVHLSRG